jgi:hypothetical protein
MPRTYARRTASGSSSSHASTTSCLRLSCSTCPSGYVRTETPHDQTVTSARTSSAISSKRCARACAGLNVKALETTRCSSPSKTSKQPPSSARKSGTIAREEHGPFDLIGDVHGCREELVRMLERLGYVVGGTRETPNVTAPAGRKAVFVGDLVDRGPDSPGVLRLVMHMVGNGTAICVPGNHDVKLQRKLAGRDVRVTHGLAETLEQLQAESDEFKREIAKFVDALVSHYVLDDGKLVVAHAGLKQELQGRTSGPACGSSRCTERRRARPTNSGYPSAMTGRAIIVAQRWSFTGTHLCPNRSG